MIARHGALALVMLTSTALLRAQQAVAPVTAGVVTPIAVAGSAPLAFGTVFRGIAKTVAFNGATSGRLAISGDQNAQLSLTFTLPTVLTSGASSLAINQYRVRTNGTNSTTGATTLTVTSGTPVTRRLINGALYVFIGGRVQPTAAQALGTYAGSIVLAAAYTGL